MTTWKRVQGDLKDTITVNLAGVANLTSVTAIVAHVWQSGVTPVNLTAAVTDATARLVTVQLGTGGGWLATAAPGTWYVEVQATFADGSVLTWPAGSPDTLVIRAQGG